MTFEIDPRPYIGHNQGDIPETEPENVKQKINSADNPTTHGLLSDVIVPIVEWCTAGPGRKAELVRAINEAAAPEVLRRNLIESWVHPDESKRCQPMLGAGLLLIRVAQNKGILPTHPQTHHE